MRDRATGAKVVQHRFIQTKTGDIMRLKAVGAAGAALALAMTLVACSSDDDAASTTPSTTAASTPSATAPAAATGDIVAVASSNPEFSTLVTAIQAAGLVTTLQGPGPFTVFAPTNAAFAALPAGVLDKLVQPQNKEALTTVLTYHAVAGDLTSSQLTNGPLTTAEGSPVTIGVNGTAVTVTDSTGTPANVIAADVDATNGVIHAIDKVLLPPGFDPATLQ
jgi:uncharacterized surface protein with fasciclin (FAS1) repeats